MAWKKALVRTKVPKFHGSTLIFTFFLYCLVDKCDCGVIYWKLIQRYCAWVPWCHISAKWPLWDFGSSPTKREEQFLPCKGLGDEWDNVHKRPKQKAWLTGLLRTSTLVSELLSWLLTYNFHLQQWSPRWSESVLEWTHKWSLLILKLQSAHF